MNPKYYQFYRLVFYLLVLMGGVWVTYNRGDLLARILIWTVLGGIPLAEVLVKRVRRRATLRRLTGGEQNAERRYVEILSTPQQGKSETTQKLANTVVGLLIKEKEKDSFIVLAAVVISFLVYVLISSQYNHTVPVGTSLFLVIIFLAILLNRSLLSYRVSQGLYGTTEHEARETIALIIKHSDKSDFSGGGGLKDLLPEPQERSHQLRDFVPSQDRA